MRDDVLKQKAIDAARQKAAAINAEMKSGDFDKAAKAAGLDVKTTELIARGAPIGDAGVSPALEAAAFAPAGRRGQRSGRHRNGRRDREGSRAQGHRGRRARQAEGLAPDRAPQRAQADKFFAAYMTKARQRMKININRETIAQIVG